MFGIDCGLGFTLKAGHAVITADGADFDAKRVQCCDEIEDSAEWVGVDVGSLVALAAPGTLSFAFRPSPTGALGPVGGVAVQYVAAQYGAFPHGTVQYHTESRPSCQSC